jgi:hypothetical protein
MVLASVLAGVDMHFGPAMNQKPIDRVPGIAWLKIHTRMGIAIPPSNQGQNWTPDRVEICSEPDPALKIPGMVQALHCLHMDHADRAL